MPHASLKWESSSLQEYTTPLFESYWYRKLFTLTIHDALSFYARHIAFASTATAKGNSNILKGTGNINSGCNWLAGKMSQLHVAFCADAVSYYIAFAGCFDEECTLLRAG